MSPESSGGRTAKTGNRTPKAGLFTRCGANAFRQRSAALHCVRARYVCSSDFVKTMVAGTPLGKYLDAQLPAVRRLMGEDRIRFEKGGLQPPGASVSPFSTLSRVNDQFTKQSHSRSPLRLAFPAHSFSTIRQPLIPLPQKVLVEE